MAKRGKGGRGADSLLTPLLDPKESGVVTPGSRSKYREPTDGTELEVYVHDDQVVVCSPAVHYFLYGTGVICCEL